MLNCWIMNCTRNYKTQSKFQRLYVVMNDTTAGAAANIRRAEAPTVRRWWTTVSMAFVLYGHLAAIYLSPPPPPVFVTQPAPASHGQARAIIIDDRTERIIQFRSVSPVWNLGNGLLLAHPFCSWSSEYPSRQFTTIHVNNWFTYGLPLNSILIMAFSGKSY